MKREELYKRIDEYTKEIKNEVIKIRRDLHKIPELSFDLPKTREYILNQLKKFDLEIRENVGNRGIVATLNFSEPGKNIAYRADMDALPIKEENDIDYKSNHEGKMHACGHDGHMTVALGILKIMDTLKDELKGSIKFIFQPAEETEGGAKGMIEDGALENPKVDFIFGSHIWPDIESGKFGLKYGPIMAGTDMMEIKVKGRGGHIAIPHKSINPLVVCSKILNEVEGFKNYFIDSNENAVINFGSIQGGDTFNVIPDTGVMKGSVRTFSPETKEIIKGKLKTVINNISEIYGATSTLKYIDNYPPTINSNEIIDKIENILIDIGESERVYKVKKPSMGAEDFSYYLQKVPGAFVFLGTYNKDKGITEEIHHPKYKMDEDILSDAAAIYTKIFIDFLS